MIYKLIGGFMIILGTSLFGFLKAKIPHERYINLLKISSGFTMMENEINYTSDCIDEIFKRISDAIEMDEIFMTFVREENEISSGTKWINAINKDAKILGLTKSDADILKMFASELGMTDRCGQIKNIKHIKALLENCINEAYQEVMRQSKMIKGVGVSVGVFIVILLM